MPDRQTRTERAAAENALIARAINRLGRVQRASTAYAQGNDAADFTYWQCQYEALDLLGEAFGCDMPGMDYAADTLFHQHRYNVDDREGVDGDGDALPCFNPSMVHPDDPCQSKGDQSKGGQSKGCQPKGYQPKGCQPQGYPSQDHPPQDYPSQGSAKGSANGLAKGWMT